jgi:plasmid maintenance system antidote protein VapI
MKGRILRFLEQKNVSATKFADTIGITRSSMSHIVSGRNKPSMDMVQKILQHYPEVNPDWLILGQGDMFRQKKVPQEPNLFSNIIETDSLSVNYNEKTNVHPTDVISEITKRHEEEQPKTSSQRKIERVVVFFSDKTYEEIH